ncbi:MAG: hypothetical protein P8175_00340 [Deltaproteobacteria bacterium]
MGKITWLVLAVFVVLLASPISSYAGRKHVYFGADIRVGHSGRWGVHRPWRHHSFGPRVYWGGTVVLGPWFPYRYYSSPPVIVQQEPPVYVQPEQEEPYYWYYCQDPQGYYPYVKTCPGGWMKVVPDVTPPQE